MIEHVCVNFCGPYAALRQELTIIETIMWASPLVPHQGDELTNKLRTSPLSEGILSQISQIAEFAEQECKRLNMEISAEKSKNLKERTQARQQYFPDGMHKEIEGLLETINLELSERKFAYLPSPNDKYFEQEKLFGDAVYEKFPQARQDVKEAGNAIAVSLATSSVFHLMRASEHGLRKLAKKLKVELTHAKKPCPVEFADWEKVITGIREKIKEARTLSAGPKKQSKLEAYSNAADHCEYMRDIWRNNSFHCRKEYSDAEAIAVLERVRDFMTFLGTYL